MFEQRQRDKSMNVKQNQKKKHKLWIKKSAARVVSLTYIHTHTHRAKKAAQQKAKFSIPLCQWITMMKDNDEILWCIICEICSHMIHHKTITNKHALQLICCVIVAFLLEIRLVCSNNLVNLLSILDEQEGWHCSNLPLSSHLLHNGSQIASWTFDY